MKQFKAANLSLFGLLVASLVCPGRAAVVDTLKIPSQAMGISPKAVIILPDAYRENDEAFPVLYLLHGWSGAYDNWPRKMDLKPLVDRHSFIIVCPDGAYAGWYLDSPLDSGSQYDSYIAREVPRYIDEHYRSIPEMRGRFLCGLSMGGHGAVSLLAKHPDRFAAAGSMSGVMQLTDSSKRFGIVQLIGKPGFRARRWRDYSCLYLVEKLIGSDKGLIIDCGVDDFTIAGNRAMHRKLLRLGIDHDYYERPGAHSWAYWTNALAYHMQYFASYFANHAGVHGE